MAFLKKLVRHFVALTFTGTVTFIILFYKVYFTKDDIISSDPLIEDFACKLPHIDPFDESIARFIHITGPIACNAKPSITYEDGNIIRINWNVVNESFNNELKYCTYRPISRGSQEPDFVVEFGNISDHFDHDVRVDDEFIKIQCFNESDDIIYTNFHAWIIPNSSREEACDQKLAWHQMINKPRETLNVLLIGVDSVSRLNSVRQMPLVRKYLLEELEAVEMKGYTKVADNTFVNVVPILTGKFVEELPWNETIKNEPFDRYGFIWKNFSQNGYRTLYVEDAPSISAFHYLKGGFYEQPTDYYPRAFSVAMEYENSVWNNNHRCVGDRLETDIVLKYVTDFTKHYANKPHFGFTFITRLTHDSENDAGAADDPHYRFLRHLDKENILNNTVLVYFSDHGMRFGDFRNTYIGKVEERMPFLFFVLPKWFRKRYPIITENMRVNSERLTTPFDLHETLKNILYFTGMVNTPGKSDRGMSLFSKIPRDRSCDDAAIMPHWCMCLERKEVSTSSKLVKRAASMVIDNINKALLQYRHVCDVLETKEIQMAVVMVANTRVLHFEESVNDVIDRTVYFGNKTEAQIIYQVTQVASPGGAVFEATLKFDESNNVFTFAGDVSRLNKYGVQSNCISDFQLKKYCFCK